MFSCEFYEVSKNIFSYRTPLVVASWYGTSHFQWDIIARKMKFLAQKKLTELFSGGKWKSLGDLLDVYKGSFGVPYVSIAFRIIYQAVTYSIKSCSEIL